MTHFFYKKTNNSLKTFTKALLATACLSVMTTSVQAAEASLEQSQLKVPGVIDSSKRVIRVKNSNTVNPAQPITNITSAPNQTTPEVQVYQPTNINSINDTGTDLSLLNNIPTPSMMVSDISFVNTVLVPTTTAATSTVDVSLLDDFIEDIEPNALHYPPNFPNRSQQYYTRERIKTYVNWLETYASAPNASYDVLLRAAKLNLMGRNLNLGSDYAVRANNYVAKAISLQPNSGEANFLYGTMLTEGGGFKEGRKYLDKAISVGYTAAEQSLAQSDLLSDNREGALQRLRRLKMQTPNDPIVDQQIKLIEEGKYYIWDIPAPDINVKPTS